MVDTVLEPLSPEACLDLLRVNVLGRIAVVSDSFPVVLPVNYRLVEEDGSEPFIALRTRSGNVIDRGREEVAFEVDDIDMNRGTGWSVLVQGVLRHLGRAPARSDLLDPHSWLRHERDSWLVLSPRVITGRRLRAVDIEWAFDVSAYL